MTAVFAHARRLLSSAIAIVLGVAFVTAALLLGDALNQTMRDAAAGTVRDAQVVVKGTDDLPVPDAFADAVTGVPGVTGVRRDIAASGEYRHARGREFVIIQPTPVLSETTRLVSGRLPAAAGEVALSDVVASRGIQLDGDLPLTVFAEDEQRVTLRVVGVVKPGFDTTPMPAMGFGAISFLGVPLLLGALIPAVARVLAPLWAAAGGVPGELAADNAVRNPKRAAATAGALLVGVTLITMMSVGATSGEASVVSDLEGRSPIDLQIGAVEATQLDRVDATVSALPEVALTAVVRTGQVGVRSGEFTDDSVTLLALDPADRSVARNPAFGQGLDAGTITVPPRWKLPEGAPVEVTGPSGTLTLKAVTGARNSDPVLVTPASMDAVTADAVPSLILRFAPGDVYDAASVVSGAVEAVAPDAELGGAAPARQEIKGVIDMLLGIVVGLLAIAVVIALVGIGNTLSLSVLERRPESALLRATGLTRAQLRRMIGLEAVLLAVVATVLGVGLGIGYGIAASHALLGQAGAKVLVVIPWGRLAIVAAVAVLAGLAASVLPAIRGSKVPPAAALTVE